MKNLIFVLFLFFSFKPLAKEQTLLFIGDSLTAGYGVKKADSYPVLVGNKLNKLGKGQFKIINGSISGSTSASAMGRLKWFKKLKPKLVLLALGANDGLRGIKVSESEKNLKKAISFAREQKMTVILVGMMMPPNYGPEYTKEFKTMYRKTAKDLKIPLIPFLLEGVAGEKSLNQNDGIHPNEKGHRIMAETVYKFVKEYI